MTTRYRGETAENLQMQRYVAAVRVGPPSVKTARRVGVPTVRVGHPLLHVESYRA